MNTRHLISLAITLFLITVTIVSCASTPKKPEVSSGIVFDQSLEKARQAVIDTLVVTGFDIKKQEDFYIEGFRPRKFGLVVGSGGETVGVWLESLDENRTKVLVKTAKSLAGIVGQKNWDENILNELRKTIQ